MTPDQFNRYVEIKIASKLSREGSWLSGYSAAAFDLPPARGEADRISTEEMRRADQIVRQIVGNHSILDVARKLREKHARENPTLEEWESGFWAGGGPLVDRSV